MFHLQLGHEGTFARFSQVTSGIFKRAVVGHVMIIFVDEIIDTRPGRRLRSKIMQPPLAPFFPEHRERLEACSKEEDFGMHQGCHRGSLR